MPHLASCYLWQGASEIAGPKAMRKGELVLPLTSCRIRRVGSTPCLGKAEELMLVVWVQGCC